MCSADLRRSVVSAGTSTTWEPGSACGIVSQVSTAASTPLVGREEELARIEAFVGAARDGPATLVLEGEPGIGKTTLWRAGVDHARELELSVLTAVPVAPERELAFAALGDLLADEHDEIHALPSPQRRALRIALLLEEAGGEPSEQRAVAAALLALLDRLGGRTPLVVAVDDLQWLDTPSASALQFALRRLVGAPVRVLATRRPGSGEPSFDGAERLALGPLPLPALERLVRERLGARFLRPTLRQLESASGGNPFYALELAAGILRSGRRPEPGERLPVPVSLQEAVLDRLATLGPGAREASLATAALAQPTVDLVLQVASEEPEALSEAVSEGVLERDGETLRFTHPLLASTLYGHSSRATRRDLHRRIAALVTDPEERAGHLAEAADGPDEELAGALEAAAAGVFARGAPDTAARLARQASELTPGGRGAEAHRRRLARARYTFAAGDPERAEMLLERHLEIAPPGRERAEVELELGKSRLATHGLSAARVCWERALALNELEGADDLELRAQILIELADTHGKELRESSTASEQAVALAERIGAPDLLAHALGVHGMKLTLLGRPPSEDYWRRALAVEKAAGGPLRYTGPTSAYGLATFLRGDHETSFGCSRRLVASMRRSGDPMLPHVLFEMSELNRVVGDWDAAARYAQDAHDLVLQTGREADEPDCLLRKARVALPRGELDLAWRDAERALALAESLARSETQRVGVEATAKSLFAQIAWISGRAAEAHDWNVAAIDAASQLGPFLEHFLGEALAGDVECLLSLGEVDEARAQLERLIEVAQRADVDTLDGITERARGVLAAAEGRFQAAVAHLERARDAFEALPVQWPFQLARTLLALGGVQRRARRKQAAQETLERALEMFERLGAPLWAEIARGELSRIGGRPLRSGALTATEQRVADLVAAGRSNAEVAHELFLSPKTVEWNLSKIYKKLHVRSRTELAGKLAKNTTATT